MLKALVPVDGSRTSERAVRHVIRLRSSGVPIEPLLMNVQQTGNAWEVQRFLKDEEIRKTRLAHAETCLRSAKRLLDRAGIAHETTVAFGDPAEEIAKHAKKGGFDLIVIGTHGRGAFAGLLMGSVAMKVLHLTNVPLTLVK